MAVAARLACLLPVGQARALVSSRAAVVVGVAAKRPFTDHDINRLDDLVAAPIHRKLQGARQG